ncbi:MAG: sigma-70 family RNA polymerase sigma factor [Nannocystaceae bacterium]
MASPNAGSDDWELLEAWRDGDAASGEILVGRYLGTLTNFFRHKVSNPDDAADLISETMLACTRGKGTIRDAAAFRSFMFAAAMNMLRRYHRKMAKRDREFGDFKSICVGDSDLHSLASLVSLRRDTQQLVRALRRIPLEYQMVLKLSFVENLTGREIAEQLGIPLPTVYTRLRRGKERLRMLIGDLPSATESSVGAMGLETWAGRLPQQCAS